jgi:hypothetical protein
VAQGGFLQSLLVIYLSHLELSNKCQHPKDQQNRLIIKAFISAI